MLSRRQLIQGAAAAVAASPLPAAAQHAQGPRPNPLAHVELPTLGGGRSSLASYRGHPVLLNIWAAWCPPCRHETPRLEATWRAHRGRGLVVVGIEQEDPLAAVRAFVFQYGVTYPILLDAAGKFGAAAGFGLPTSVFLNRQGDIVGVFEGEMRDSDIRDALRRILE
jgi:cytochrome c biogenesis protein CcmG, thiol:disulfide interchange protein DsbE